MASFLQMVNRTLELLRFDAVPTIAGAADPVTLVTNIVNRSARTVLEHRIWNFLIRDATIAWPAEVTGTGALIAADGSMLIPEVDISQAVFGDTFTSWHFSATEDANYGETFLQVESFQTSGGAHIPSFVGFGNFSPFAADSTAAYRLIPNMRMFPANVRQILAAKFQENPIEIVQESRTDFNHFFPDWHDETGDPELIVIGGTTSPSTNLTLPSPQTQVYGRRMLLWPAPTVRTIVDLEVVWLHDELAADSDSLSGVPEHICDLIVLRSAVDGLLGQVVADERRGMALSNRYEVELGRAVNQDQSDPGRRRVPIPFGDRPLQDPHSRWERRTIIGPP